jgi:hypothetical protein
LIILLLVEMSFISLPNEIQLVGLAHLDYGSLMRISGTNRRFQAMLSSNQYNVRDSLVAFEQQTVEEVAEEKRAYELSSDLGKAILLAHCLRDQPPRDDQEAHDRHVAGSE